MEELEGLMGTECPTPTDDDGAGELVSGSLVSPWLESADDAGTIANLKLILTQREGPGLEAALSVRDLHCWYLAIKSDRFVAGSGDYLAICVKNTMLSAGRCGAHDERGWTFCTHWRAGGGSHGATARCTDVF